jgi:hypothetical protein
VVTILLPTTGRAIALEAVFHVTTKKEERLPAPLLKDSDVLSEFA